MNNVLDLLKLMETVEPLSKFQKAQVENLLNMAYNAGQIDQLRKFVNNE